MDEDLKKLRKMTAFMRKQGVLRVKTSEMEVELSPAAILGEPEAPTPAQSSAPEIPRVPTEDEQALGLPAGALDLIDWSNTSALPQGVAG